MANLNGVAGDTVGSVVTQLMNRFQPFVDQSEQFFNIISALKNGSIVNGAVLTLDRLQIMENHEVRILPPTPPDTCNAEVTKAFDKEAIDDKIPLAGLPNVELPKAESSVNGSN
jgi:hypothetical protein